MKTMNKKLSKLICLYGCDNSGKTTACNNISKWLTKVGISNKVVHSCGPCSPPEQLMFMNEMVLSEHKEEVIILDRFPAIEEAIYGPILRNGNALEPFYNLCVKYLSCISLFIYCNPDIKVIEQWGEREQFEGVKEHTAEIIKGYQNIVITYPVLSGKVKLFDYTKGSEVLKGILKEWLKNEYHRC